MNNIFIKIQNQGEIEKRAFHLIGASTKRDDESKIGFFGSGNKYAIALLLRKNIFFKVYSGEKEIKFGKKSTLFRGQKYEVITIDGIETSMTTDMGPTWEDWFAIREFYCNAVDEGKATLSVDDKYYPEKGVTNIFIEKTQKLDEFFSVMDKYILTNDEKNLATIETKYKKVTILPKISGEFIAYRKGIRVTEKNEKDSLYRYNFDHIDINESRIAEHSYQIGERIASFFAKTTDRKLIINYLNNWQEKYEADIQWEYADSLSHLWLEVLKPMRVYPLAYAINLGDPESKAQSFIVPNQLAKKISDEFPEVNVVGYSKGLKYTEVEPNPAETEQIARNLDFLSSIGYKITSKIILAEFYLDDTIASYNKERDFIILSRKYLKQQNDLELQNTLLEEYFHSLGKADGERAFVTYLIDEIIKAKGFRRGIN